MPPSLWNLRSKWSTPLEKRRLRPISTHNVSTVRDSEKSSNTTNIKSTTDFPTSHRWSAYVTPKCPKGWLKERVFCFYRATACNATHCIAVAILSVCLSVCPSGRCVYCDKTKQRTANILIPHETAITLVFWHQQWLVGDAPFPLKSALKVSDPLRKTPTSTDFRS